MSLVYCSIPLMPPAATLDNANGDVPAAIPRPAIINALLSASPLSPSIPATLPSSFSRNWLYASSETPALPYACSRRLWIPSNEGAAPTY